MSLPPISGGVRTLFLQPSPGPLEQGASLRGMAYYARRAERRHLVNAVLTKSRLTPCRRRLVELFQTVNFGRIEALQLRQGEPELTSPRVVREVKFGGDNQPRPELRAGDFHLKTQLVELFAEFDRIGDGTIDCLEFKHGLPFRMDVTCDLR